METTKNTTSLFRLISLLTETRTVTTSATSQSTRSTFDTVTGATDSTASTASGVGASWTMTVDTTTASGTVPTRFRRDRSRRKRFWQ